MLRCRSWHELIEGRNEAGTGNTAFHRFCWRDSPQMVLWGSLQHHTPMATPNYSFEKRKREQAQKAAKEAKRLRKAAAKTSAAETPVLTEEPTADAASVS